MSISISEVLPIEVPWVSRVPFEVTVPSPYRKGIRPVPIEGIPPIAIWLTGMPVPCISIIADNSQIGGTLKSRKRVGSYLVSIFIKDEIAQAIRNTIVRCGISPRAEQRVAVAGAAEKLLVFDIGHEQIAPPHGRTGSIWIRGTSGISGVLMPGQLEKGLIVILHIHHSSQPDLFEIR